MIRYVNSELGYITVLSGPLTKSLCNLWFKRVQDSCAKNIIFTKAIILDFRKLNDICIVESLKNARLFFLKHHAISKVAILTNTLKWQSVPGYQSFKYIPYWEELFIDATLDKQAFKTAVKWINQTTSKTSSLDLHNISLN
jgi:hypothetical protein